MPSRHTDSRRHATVVSAASGIILLQLLGPGRGTSHAPPEASFKPQAGNLREEVGGDAAMGWRPDLQEEVQDAKQPEAGQRGSWEHQEACLAVLPDQDGALPVWAVPCQNNGRPEMMGRRQRPEMTAGDNTSGDDSCLSL